MAIDPKVKDLMTIEERFLDTSNHGVYSSNIPSSGDFTAWAKNLNFFKAKGMQLIPATQQVNIITGSSTDFVNPTEYHYDLVVFPVSQSLLRIWEFRFYSENPYNGGSVKIGVSSSRAGANSDVNQTLAFLVQPGPGAFTPPRNGLHLQARYYEHLTQSTVPHREEFLSLTVSVTTTGLRTTGALDQSLKNLYLESVCVYDVPRPYLSGAAGHLDNAIDERLYTARTPIFAQAPLLNPAVKGTNAFLYHLSESIAVTRQAGIYHWMHPVSVKSPTWNSASFAGNVPSTTTSLTLNPIPVEGRRKYVSTATGQTTLWMYIRGYNSGAAADGTSTYSLNCTSSVATTSNSITIATNTFFWLSSSFNTGVQVGSGSNLNWGYLSASLLSSSIGKNSGNGKLFIYDIHIGERRD